MSFSLPQLPYNYESLEPHIDARTMEIHYTKHHQGYTDKLNAALESAPEFAALSIEELLTQLDSLPENIRTAVRNNGGGYYNHSLFWNSMSPDGGGEPTGKLAEMIVDAFGDFTSFQQAFTDAAATRFGSGWAWLVQADSGLKVLSTPNQDNPIMDNSGTPLLGLDVWEHAYYLNYQNRRPDYISAWWKVVDWDAVASRLA